MDKTGPILQHPKYGVTRRQLRNLLPTMIHDEYDHLSEQGRERVEKEVFTRQKMDIKVDRSLIEATVRHFGPMGGFRSVLNRLQELAIHLTPIQRNKLFRLYLSLRSLGLDLVGGRPVCREDLLDYYREDLFLSHLRFVPKGGREWVGQILFVMLMGELRAEAFKVRPWSMSTRHMASLLLPGLSTGSHQRVHRGLQWLTGGNESGRSIFQIVKKPRGTRATSYELHPRFGYLGTYLVHHIELENERYQ